MFKEDTKSSIVVRKKWQEYCPHCASGEYCTHEYRIVTVRDEPIRGKEIILHIRKRRLRCKKCKKIFTESVLRVIPRGRFTQRFKRSLNWVCQNFRDLKKVRKTYRCSTDTVYKAHYAKLRINLRKNINYAWSSTIGVNECAFRRVCRGSSTTFATMS